MRTGSAPPRPPSGGPALTTLQASHEVADWPVAPPRFAPRLSTTHGGFATGDLGVSPDRTRTGRLPSACRSVTSQQPPSRCCRGARAAGRTRKRAEPGRVAVAADDPRIRTGSLVHRVPLSPLGCPPAARSARVCLSFGLWRVLRVLTRTARSLSSELMTTVMTRGQLDTRQRDSRRDGNPS
jgi:hypothetical protein